MYATETLDIAGYRGENVPNTFFRQQERANHVAIVFPGFGYTCDMPLPYYAVLVALDSGADVLQVEYAYSRRDDYRAAPEDERERWLREDASAACDAALVQGEYSRVALIGKSIGTRAMGYVLTTDTRLSHARAVWLTPLLRNDRLREQMRQHRPSMYVIGTDDPHYDLSLVSDVQEATGGHTVVIEGGDHSLEIAGNPLQSLDALAATIRALHTFVSRAG